MKSTVMILSKRAATRGKVVKLHKYWKGVAASIINKESRRQFLNLMLDATMTEIENKQRKQKDLIAGDE